MLRARLQDPLLFFLDLFDAFSFVTQGSCNALLKPRDPLFLLVKSLFLCLLFEVVNFAQKGLTLDLSLDLVLRPVLLALPSRSHSTLPLLVFKLKIFEIARNHIVIPTIVRFQILDKFSHPLAPSTLVLAQFGSQ